MVMNQGKLLLGVIAGLVILLMIAACGDEEPQSQNASQGPENLPPATTTNEYQAGEETDKNQTAEYHSSGAIAKSKELRGQSPRFQSLREEASQLGITLMSWEEDEYRQIRNRLLTNDALASALRTVTDEGILVSLRGDFQVKTRFVHINVGATDEEIINFLVSSLPEAKTRKAAFEELTEEAKQFGITLMLFDEDEYIQIRDRLFANEELASALRVAKHEGVALVLARKFYVNSSGVHIDVDANDKEIIEFLIGK